MEFRKVDRLDGETWTEIPFENLRNGDTFRLFDETNDASGETKSIEDGTVSYVATSDAFPCEPAGNFGIEAHPKNQQKHRHGHFTHEEIADLAYTIWQLSGEPEGEALANWYEAETILRSPITEILCDEK